MEYWYVSQEKFRVDETALPWFNLYLRPRSSRVLVGEEFSKSADLSFSVSGSIFYSDLDILGYADDHTLYDSLNPGVVGNEQIVLVKLESCLKPMNQ